MRKLLLVLLTGTLLLVGCHYDSSQKRMPPDEEGYGKLPPTFGLRDPLDPVKLSPGEQKQVDLRITRHKGYDEDVTIKIAVEAGGKSNGPKIGVPSKVVIPSGESEASFPVTAKKEIKTGDYHVILTAQGPDTIKVTRRFRVSVEAK